MKLTDLQIFLDDYLRYDQKFDLTKVDPHMANGLQFKGEEKINKIGLAVSASLRTFKLAVEQKCHALIVHHGLNYPPDHHYHQIFQERYGFLVKNNLSLFGYHFLLDSHPEIGHNRQILKLIEAKNIRPYLHRDTPWGYMGELSEAPLENARKRLQPCLSPNSLLYPFGRKTVKTVAVCSGSAVPHASEIQYLLDNKVDLYITGEVSEWVREFFREAKISYLAGGHYHTERFGLLALQKILKAKLNVEVEFLELENKV